MGLLKCLIYMAFWGLLSFPMGRLFSRRNLRWDRLPFRTMKWERDGLAYVRLGIRKWKDLVPDVSRMFPGIVPRKSLGMRPTVALMEEMLRENCVAELVHWILCLLGLMMIPLWPGPGGIVVTVYVSQHEKRKS